MSEPMSLAPSYKRAAKGPVIKQLQKKLGLARDGIFGKDTTAAIRTIQKNAGMAQTGHADERVFRALGMEFPDQWLRVMNFTSALEGTDFGGVNRKDIDGWGITMGIVGFTSRNGEVQELFSKFYQKHPALLLTLIPTQERRNVFMNLLRYPSGSAAESNKRWKDFAYGDDGYIREDFRLMVRALGEEKYWREIQISTAYKTYYLPSAKQTEKMGFRSMAAYGMMYDIWVQNGGWRPCHEDFYKRHAEGESEERKLLVIAHAAANCASKQWRSDVLSRKKIFANTAGFAHGEYFDLINHAFEGVD
jgi:peptidoglycan hydrolase-like protein with peptidoglycan-binding domain